MLEARLAQVDDVTGQLGSPSLCTEDGICIDSAYRLTFVVRRNLAGPAVARNVSLTQTSAKPIVGRDYLLVVQDSEIGAAVLWSGPAVGGLCLERVEATRYGLAQHLARYPCRS